MKTSLTVAALLALGVHTNAFAPLTSRVQTRATLRRSLSQRQMVMHKPDPLNLLENSMAEEKNVSTDPTPFFVSLIQNVDKKSKMQMAAAAMAMALAVLPLQADAAMSGGRMGGSFSSRSPMRSYSSPSRSYSGSSRGYSSGSYSRPSVIVAPGVGYGYSPYMTPYGGAGVMSIARGPSFFDLFLLGGFMFAAVSFFRGAGETVSSGSTMDLFDSSTVASALGPGTAVLKVSVALEVPNRDDSNSILSALQRLANTARTDSRVGIQNLTSQVALELLRRRSSIISATSSYQHFGSREKAGREFQSRSVQERSKFEKEAVSKFGGVDYSSSGGSGVSGDLSGKATMAVVTLVLAIDGDSTKIPMINSMSDIEDALRKIASDSKVDDCLQSAEILWTPEDRTESLSLREVIADYPELRSV